MERLNRAGSLGGLLLAGALLGYLLYQLVLYPGAGFPTPEIPKIIAGAPTLRIGHWLKFADALSLALLTVALHARLREDAPLLAHLAAIAGAAAAALFLTSGTLGLRILAVAEYTLPTNPTEAEVTILLRTVTIALFEAATTAAGVWALFVCVAGARSKQLSPSVWVPGVLLALLFIINGSLSEAAMLLAVLLAIGWSIWLSILLWREGRDTGAPASTADNLEVITP